MCGICGILSFGGKVNMADIIKMNRSLSHRGPDGEGIWINEQGNIGFGHRRLSIIDITDAGKQPMQYANGRYTITYNGEIYNYIEIKNYLIKKGYSFHSATDTEVILALYDFKKDKMLDDLDGMFAFAIWDEANKNLFCARDRFGEKPFFYYFDKQRFIFASEIKALLQINLPKIKNLKQIYNYLLYGVIQNPLEPHMTFFENIYQLEPSHYFKIQKDGSFIKKKYWDINYKNNLSITEAEAIKKFQEIFQLSIKRRLRSDVPVGSSLSGGLDSSSIVMMINKIKNNNQLQKTFSARFKNFIKDEGHYMDIVIRNSRVEPHFVYPTHESVLNNLHKIIYHHEIPIGSTSVAAQYEVMKLAKENNIKVLLDGQGADETLAGYITYFPSYLMQLFREDKHKFKIVKNDLERLHLQKFETNSFEFLWKSFSYSSYKVITDIIRSFRMSQSAYFYGIHPDIVSMFKKEKNPIYKPPNLKENLYYSTLRSDLINLLHYADRNSMAHSIEVRLPFLFHELVEFIFQLPDDFIIHNGWTKYILRKSMENILPKEIAWRKDKIGYEPPQSEWFNLPSFKDLFYQSVQNLKKEKIIIKEYPELLWNYAMIDLLYKIL